MTNFYEFSTLEEMQAASAAEDQAILRAAQVEYQATLTPTQKISQGLKKIDAQRLNQLTPDELQEKRIESEKAIAKTAEGLAGLSEMQKQKDAEKMAGVGNYFQQRAVIRDSVLRG